MTLPAAVAALLGRRATPPDSVPVEPVVEPPVHPYRALLESLNARSFESLAECAARRVECGMPHGAVDTVLDTYRNPVGVRVRRYRSDVEAEVDRRIVDLSDRLNAERDAGERDLLGARLDVARRLQPLAALWYIENELAALGDAALAERAPAPPQRPATAPEPVRSQSPTVGYDANIRGLNAQRADVQRDRRAFAVEQFEARQEAQTRRLAVPSPDADDAAQRVGLEARRAAWKTEHPTLAAEVASFG